MDTLGRTVRIVVVGSSGQLARALVAKGSARGCEMVALGRPDIDLAVAEGARQALEASSPEVIVNAAAYTAVDAAENEPELAMRINGDGAGAVARAACALDVPVIHVSTDYVFDGHKVSAYLEDDPAAPINAYGLSKLEGERRVRAAAPKHVILRTSWIYSPYGRNFVKTMLRLTADRDVVDVVADQTGCPTSALDLAEGVLTVAARLVSGASPDCYGTFHMTGTGVATWAELADRVFSARDRLGGPSARVRRITTRGYPTLARRPTNTALDCTRLANTYQIQLPDWGPSVDVTVAELIAGGWPESGA